MIDVKRIRAQPEEMREAIRKRHVNPERANLDRWLELDEQKRALETELAGLNAERNKLAQLGRSDPAASGKSLPTASADGVNTMLSGVAERDV